MARGRLSTVMHHLHLLADGAQPGDASDADLLERFAARRDEAAFAALVKRHGPLVLATCRRVLGNHADAEDAFQATFLVLVRKAGSIRRRAALAAWLHEVALRVAVQARASAGTRRRHEQRVPDMPQKDFLAAVVWRDLQPLLDEEVQALPETCRTAFVLCYLDGKTYEEAARELGCPTGTLSRRLAQARRLLRARLTRRGLVLPAGLLTAALSSATGSTAVPAPLIAVTVKAAFRSAAGTAAAGAASARVAALAEGGLQAMKASKTKTALALLLAAGLVFGSAAALAGLGQTTAASPAGDKGAPGVTARPPVTPVPRTESGREEAAQKAALSGQVLDANGKPVPGAHVALFGRRNVAPRGTAYRNPLKFLAEVRTGREGKFRFAADGPAFSAYRTTFLIARAPGHGLIRHALRLDRPGAELRLRLLKERPLHGRLVDLQGQPAAGVTIQLAKLYGPPPIARYFAAECEHAPAVLKDWPGPVVSDAQGRFTLRGLPAGCKITLLAHGGTCARQYLEVPQGAASAGEVIRAVAPGRILHGTVTYGDTGRPVPNARMRILSVRVDPTDAQHVFTVDARADGDGHFRVVPFDATYYVVAAYPPAGKPYLFLSREVLWPRGAVLKHEVNLALRRGVRVAGVVKEAPSGKPVAGAVVEFEPRRGNNPFFSRDVLARFVDLNEPVLTGADGTFTTVVLPGPGHLLINGPTADYLHTGILSRDLFGVGPPLSQRYYPDGLVRLDLKPNTPTRRVEVTLRRGETLKGRVLGPDGQAVARGLLFCRTYVARGYTLDAVRGLPFRDGRFELPGWDPADPADVYFLSPELGLGGVLRLKSGEGAKEPTVRLQKCSAARARIVDDQGKPFAGERVVVTVVLTPGRPDFDPGARFNLNGAAADVARLADFDPENFSRLRTDAEGRVELRHLIPGARHWILVSRPTGREVHVPVDLIPEAGKVLELNGLTVPNGN